MTNSNLGAAKQAKNDEFYTQYHDIEVEMNAYLDYVDILSLLKEVRFLDTNVAATPS